MMILVLPDELEKRLEHLAKKTQLSSQALALCALEEFLDVQDEQ